MQRRRKNSQWKNQRQIKLSKLAGFINIEKRIEKKIFNGLSPRFPLYPTRLLSEWG